MKAYLVSNSSLKSYPAYIFCPENIFVLSAAYIQVNFIINVFMPPKELWEAYSNRTVRPSVCPSRFVSGAYLLYSLR